MRQKCLFILFVCIVVISCNKPLPDYSGAPFDYTVSGLDSLSLAANDNTTLRAAVMVITGDATNNPIAIKFTGLPSNVFMQNDSLPVRANYYLADSIGARNATPGVYNMEAIFTNRSTTTKTYKFTLTITPPLDRTALVDGYYYPSANCGPGIYVSCEIDSVPGQHNRIMIIDRISPNEMSYGNFDTCYGIVDCCTNTFTIPSQKVQGATVSGSGSSNGMEWPYRVMNMTRTIKTDTSNYICTLEFSQ